jgi:hypothetical protein
MVHSEENSYITPLIDAATIYGCRCSLSRCRTVAAEAGAQDAPKDVATVVALAPSFLASVVVVVLVATDGGCSHSELELVCTV